MPSTIVVALGGNALGETAKEQFELLRKTAKPLVDLISDGNRILIVHGNGPQVGMLNTGLDYAYETGAIHTNMPLPECVALTQGYIGYHLQNAIQTELAQRKINKKIATVITQVVVDSEDGAFDNPTKPIGQFYSEKESSLLVEEKKYCMAEENNKGYRRLVPSPKPVYIVEKEVIQSLLESGHIVIAAGGGGIPVIQKNGGYEGIAAVVDKDAASEKLAEGIDADFFIMLTTVENVSVSYGKPEQRQLGEVTVSEMEKYKEEGHFASGSMLPKVEAAIEFVKSRENRITVITSLQKASEGIKRQNGTIISNHR